MFWRILKKDLRRKRAMNVILLVFIILASMFMSSGVSNIVTVTTALDSYFEMANVPDYFAMSENKSNRKNIRRTLENASAIDGFCIEEFVSMSQSNITRAGEPLNVSNLSQKLILQGDRNMGINYFLDDGSILKSVPKGKIYAARFTEKNMGLKAGDKITVEIEGISREFTFAGGFRDAVYGTELIGMKKFILNGEDFDEYMSDETIKNMYGGKLLYIHTADLGKAISQIADISDSFAFAGDGETLDQAYIFDMIIMGLILAVSIILIIISFTVLRFTISFTLSEEFREIGVMKAIGIRNIKIRGLYLTKYFAISVAGAGIGLVFSYPFGKMLINYSSESMIIDSGNNGFINAACAVLVAAVILMFCLGCTGRVGKMSPIDAVRNGQTGERFRKKSIMGLGRSRLGTTAFLAANDIVSSPKRYAAIIFTFFLCMSLLIILSNATASLKSRKMAKYFGMADCHAVTDIGDEAMEFMAKDGHEKVKKYLEDMEQALAENGMPAECMAEYYIYSMIKHSGYESKAAILQGTGTTMDMYEYSEGTPPQDSSEIAVTALLAKKLDADIGDTVTLSYPTGETAEFIITALYQSMVNQGISVRAHTGCDINYTASSGSPGTQIKFTDNPDDKEVLRRIEKIKELYPKFSSVKTAGETVKDTTGVGDAIDGEVLFCGRNITAMGERELADLRLDEMGFIFQQMYMLKNLTVLDNIILPAAQSKKNRSSRRQTDERGRALMRRLGIDDVGGSDINEVSGGQLQRACICRSMINNPKIIFADEPTGALNRSSSDEVMNELLSLNRDGTTVMCVTHDPKVAAKCSRVLYIMDGGIMGEKEMGHFGGSGKELRGRERELNNWLIEQGW